MADRAVPVDVIARAIEATASVENVGEYGYGGEVYPHHELTNTDEVAFAVLEQLQRYWDLVEPKGTPDAEA